MEANSEAPWSKAPHGYVGWVPNVRSHLSFSLIASARHAEAFSCSYNGRAERLVMVYEERISHDLPWSGRRIRRSRPDLVHRWVLEGRTRATPLPILGCTEEKMEDGKRWLVTDDDRQGMLLGTVHVLPDQEVAGEITKQAAAIKAIRAAIDRPSNARADEDQAVNAELDRLRDCVLERLADCANRVELSFALLRTGELRLWYASATTPNLPAEQLFQLAEQAYFFIKDAVHDHAHHDRSSDQITPLTRIRNDRTEPGHGNEIAWRRETLWSLSREVERLHRKGGLVSLRQSLGVIAYAEAFQSYLMGHERSEEHPTKFRKASSVHDYDFKHLKDSVKASIDVASTKQSQAVQIILAGGGTFISMASLATALMNAHNATAKELHPPGDLLGIEVPGRVLGYFVTNPMLAGALAAVVLMMAVAYRLADGEGGLFNPGQRVLSQWSRAASVSLSTTDEGALGWDVLFHLVLVLASLATVAGLLFLIWWCV